MRMKKGSHHSEAAKERNRQKHLGKPCSEKAKKVNRARWEGEDNPMKNKRLKDLHSERMKTDNPMKKPEVCAKVSAARSDVPLSEEHKENIRTGTIEALADPDVRRRMSESHKDVPRPRWVRDAISTGKSGKEFTDQHCKNIKIACNLPEFKKKVSGKNNHFYGKNHSEEAIEIIRENAILCKNEIWYGGVKYPDDKRAYYCEKWNKKLRERIRTFWGNKSALSGKTKEENGGRELSCHHVYYQKTACCFWDEDINGYYAWIDNEKYYIRGDPNKFVPLTTSEHKMIDNNKIKWIQFFEDLIETKGDKSYFTKEEMQEFLLNFSQKGFLIPAQVGQEI
jgi:hypothetical protein